MFPTDKKINTSIKKIIFICIYNISLVCLFMYFLHCIKTVPTFNYLYFDDGEYYNADLSTSVSNFNSDSIINTDDELDLSQINLNNFLNNVFKERNSSFLNGSVANLYQFYRTSSSNGKYSLDYEFKRISYLRDWSIERGIIFTSINSLILINNIHIIDNKLIVKADEQINFNYIYHKNKSVTNSFSATIPHIFTIYSYSSNYDDLFLIDKDYFCDIFNDELDSYIFTLTETTLPYTKRLNDNFEIPTEFQIDDILRFEKLLFTDRKAVVSGFDSNKYPLINSSLLDIKNMPFDLGWKQKNIKLCY